MADLVLSDAALASLKDALSGALKDLEAVQRSLGKADANVLGAAAVVSAETSYATTRGADLATTGSGLSRLKSQVDKVGEKMNETDLRLGSNAHHAVSE
jgi:hypothetical protein